MQAANRKTCTDRNDNESMTEIIWTVHLVVVMFLYVCMILLTQWSREPVCTVTD